MAPIKSIIHTIYERWPERTCHLFFGCRAARDVFYRQEFEEIARRHQGFHITYALSDPEAAGEDWDGDLGFIHLSVDKRLDHNPRRQVFLCGPPPMIEAVTKVLDGKGVEDKNIFYDRF